MSMATNDIVQLTVSGTYLSQQWMNVFHYKVITPQTVYDPITVMDAFASDVMGNILQVCVSLWSFTTIDFKNLTNALDIASNGYTVAGGVSGDGLPAFAAWAFRLNRASALTRHGHKRFTGVPESMQTNGSASGTAPSILASIASILASDLVEDSQNDKNFTLRPVIVGRTLNQSGDYELDLSKINTILSAQYVNLSTQNTRKAGRGG